MNWNRVHALFTRQLTGRRMLLAILGAFGFLQALLVLTGGPGFEMKVMVSFGLAGGMVLAFADIILFGEPGRKRALVAAATAGLALLVAILGWPGEGGPLLLALLGGFLACYVLIKKDRFVLYRWLFSGFVVGVALGILCGLTGMWRVSPPLFSIFVLVSVPLIWLVREKLASRMAFGEHDDEEKKKSRTILKIIWENLMIVVSAVLIAACLRVTIVDNYEIPTGSMIPNLLEGDRLFVHKFVYGMRFPVLPNWKLPPFAVPGRGDVVIFQYPCYVSPGPVIELADLFTFSLLQLERQAKNFVKRLIGMPGDLVRVNEQGELFVNGKLIPRLFHQKRVVMVYHKRDGRQLIRRNDIYVNEKLEHSYMFAWQGQQFADDAGMSFYQLPADGRFVFTERQEYTLYNEAGRIVQYKTGPGILRPFPPRPEELRLTSQVADRFIQRNMLQDHAGRQVVKVIREEEYPQWQDKPVHLVIAGKEGEVSFRLAGRERTPLFVRHLGQLWVKVPQDHYFMMGDNRDDSSDSRDWGFVHKGFVLGGPLVRYWPFKRFGTIR